MTEYNTGADYEFAWTMEEGRRSTGELLWEAHDLYECKHCGMYCCKEPMLEHLDKEHWWLHHPERIVLP